MQVIRSTITALTFAALLSQPILANVDWAYHARHIGGGAAIFGAAKAYTHFKNRSVQAASQSAPSKSLATKAADHLTGLCQWASDNKVELGLALGYVAAGYFGYIEGLKAQATAHHHHHHNAGAAAAAAGGGK